jgi:lipoprotein-releasing system permease protein
MITTLAVMSGFQREIRDRMLQMAAHATVSGYGEPCRTGSAPSKSR